MNIVKRLGLLAAAGLAACDGSHGDGPDTTTPPEQCGAVTCEDGFVCDGAACVASPYDRDYVITLWEGHTDLLGRFDASVRVGGKEVLVGPASITDDTVRWDARALVHVGLGDAWEVTLHEASRGEVARAAATRVPYALLATGALTVQGEHGSIDLRAVAVDGPPECLVHGDCDASQHCQDFACAAGEDCGEATCGTDQICGAGACVASPYDIPYVLTLVSAHMAAGNWDSGFEEALAPDPRVQVKLGDELILTGPEVENTHDATWDVSVTRTFGAYTPLTIELVDIDVTEGGQIAIQQTLPRLPYELVRDGTLTVSQNNCSVTFTLAPAP
ncbi:MAG: hypothetical protein U1F43_11235 [Myxococcota bacterium]